MTQTVMITGASRGIGKAICARLIDKSSVKELVMVARDDEKLSETIDQLRINSNQVKITPVISDLDNPNEVDKIYDTIERENVNIDTIINNAGYAEPKSINETTLEDFEKTMRVNLYSPFKIIQAAILRNQPLKQVLNIASTAGISGRPGWVTYSASKAAMINMSEVMREEFKPYDIDVICISPGRCATDLRKRLAPDEDPKTIMQPEQVASVVQYLLSEPGALLMSQNLVVRT